MLLLLLLACLLWTPDLDRAALEARWLRAPADLVAVDGVRLHVRDDGPRDAPTLLLLHGFAASLHTWEPWAQALQERYRVIRLDLPGTGLSGPDPTGDYSDGRTRALLLALMAQSGVARATLVGHSLGGRLALDLAAHHPDRVARLVLVAPTGFDQAPEAAPAPAPAPAGSQWVRHVMPLPLLRLGLEAAYADPSQATYALALRYQDLLRAPGARAAWLARMAQSPQQDAAPWRARIHAPTLLMWGAQDRIVPARQAEAALAALPTARLVGLPGVGHVPQEEAPEASLAALREFLDSAD
jgi:pimeloyl-ACP methyl ester carboxylesterase